MRMILVSLLSLGLILSACSPNSDARDAAAKLKRETDGAARKAGRAAFQLTRETKEAAAKAERKLKDAGRDAKAGWDDAKHKAEAEEGK